MTGDYELIPDLLTRVALKDIEEHSNEVEKKDTQDTDSDRDAYSRVCFSCGVKYPVVLKEYRKLCKESRRVVNDGVDVDPLSCQ